MSNKLNELVDLLRLEKIEEDLFVGQSQDLGWGTVFGGQVLGQALSAAGQTVDSARHAHSLHAYFLRLGDVKRPVVYEVDRIRDGRSFATRRVVAIQKGRPIFNLSASFQKNEKGYEHQDKMPDVLGPEHFKSERDLAQLLADRIPEPMKERALGDRPIELRPVAPLNPFHPPKAEAKHAVWYRALGDLPDDPALHQYLLAYASDFHFLTTATRPHGVSWLSGNLQIASLDHAMWFHRDFRFDQWLLHVVESPSASGARGLVRGRFFSEDGVLLASTMQEGLMRPTDRDRGG